MRARIYQPARNAMQSGQARTKSWVLDYSPSSARVLDPLMGWTGTSDTSSQIRLTFDNAEAAQKYATDHGLEYVVMAEHTRQPVLRAGGYGANFATTRRTVWTH
ncbi:MAG: ETC complex I subunit [Paracoccaceae bacterium]